MAAPYASPLFFAKPATQGQAEKRQLTKEEVEEIRFAFDTLDAERTGLVTPQQLKAGGVR